MRRDGLNQAMHPGSISKLALAVLVTGLGCGVLRADTSELTEKQRDTIAFESLRRLQGVDVQKNPALKAAVDKLLLKTRGTPQFLSILKQFNITDQDQGLLDLAVSAPASDSGVAAMQVILAHDNTNLLTMALQGTNPVAVLKITEALGNSVEKKAVPLLLPLITDKQRDLSVRKQAVKSLAQTSEGATKLVGLARDKILPDDLNYTAAMELNAVRWDFIKVKAAKFLPLPVGQNAKPLPPTAELLQMKGDAGRGEKVFFRAQPGCANCHRVRGQGAQIGPELSEIGTKLGKDAIIEAILDPSAGISVGYESYSLQLKSGDEAFGLLASESTDEIAIKDLKGIITRHKKSEILSRQQSKTSIMPTGLQQAMTTREFVDLVEFLAELRK